MSAPSPQLVAIVAFLREIGLPIREDELPDETFLPGVSIASGTLVYDPARLKWPCDLLHEGGHIAVTPPAHRAALDGRLTIEHEVSETIEVEAIAWSFAAAVHLGIPLADLFHADGYRGHSRGLALSFSLGVYPGVAGLAGAGLTNLRQEAAADGTPTFPHMLRWLRE